MQMQIWLLIIVIVSAVVAGLIIGFFVSQKYTKKYLSENPPINEDMIRMMYSQMGRKPSEKQVRQIMASMNIGTKK